MKGTAEPKRGSVMRTARCRWCDEVLYSYPGQFWFHDAGDEMCDLEEDA